MITVVELPEFIKASADKLSAEEIKELIDFLATNPASGVLIKGTGGIRKLRWGSLNKGKSGSIRVIYYYHSNRLPLFLITMFAKNQRVNLTQAQCHQLARLVGILKNNYGVRSE